MSKLTLSIYLSLLIGGFDGMLSSHQIDGENNFPSTPSIVHKEQVWLDTIANDTSELESNQMYFENYEVLSKYECIGSLDNFSQNLNSGFLVLNKGLELFQTNFKTSGSCWTYVNKVYDMAGFTSGKRDVIYAAKKGTLIKDPSIIMPGDWLFHVNYSFRNVEHSAIFVCWQDKEKLLAVTLSHVGQNKYAGGDFGVYDLKGVYRVTRAKN
ncbi:MAG: hypothetical protein RLZZ358_412 [Bacteroidota bacterium]|jgi:hypothetical protein